MIVHKVVLLAFFTSIFGIAGAGAQNQAMGSARKGAPLPVGTIQMPLVNPNRAAAMLRVRRVPRSNLPVSAAELSKPKQPVMINVAPMLGHPLPSGSTTVNGFRRAPFATAKPNAEVDAKKRRDEALGLSPRRLQ